MASRKRKTKDKSPKKTINKKSKSNSNLSKLSHASPDDNSSSSDNSPTNTSSLDNRNGNSLTNNRIGNKLVNNRTKKTTTTSKTNKDNYTATTDNKDNNYINSKKEEERGNKFKILDLLFNSEKNDSRGSLLTPFPSSQPIDTPGYTNGNSLPINAKSLPRNNGKLVEQNKGDVTDLRDNLQFTELKRLSPEVYERVRTFLKNLCRATEEIFSRNLTETEAFHLLSKDIDNIYLFLVNDGCNGNSSCNGGTNSLNGSYGTNKIENKLLNILYEKFLLIIIYTCKYHPSLSCSSNNNKDNSNKDNSNSKEEEEDDNLKVIERVSRLIYQLVSHIYSKFILNRLTYIWDILLLLIHTRDKRVQVHFLKFLQIVVENSCLDEIVVNSQLYKKHILNVVNLLNQSNGSLKRSKRNANSTSTKMILYKLLQSFQIKEVLNIFLNNLKCDLYADESIKVQIVEILDIFDSALLEDLVLKLEGASQRVRAAIYRKLSPHFENLSVYHILYVFLDFLHTSSTVSDNYPHFSTHSVNYPYNSSNTNNPENPHTLNNYKNMDEGEQSEKSKEEEVEIEQRVYEEEFVNLLNSWISGDLENFLRVLLGASLQLNLVVEALARYSQSARANSRLCLDATNLAKFEENLQKLENKFLLYLTLKLTNINSINVDLVLDELDRLLHNMDNEEDNSYSNNNKLLVDNYNNNMEKEVKKNKDENKREEMGCLENGVQKREVLIVNEINLLLLTVLEFLEKDELEFAQSQRLEFSLRKLLRWGPAKFVVPTLIFEYVRLGQMQHSFSLNRCHLLSNNLLYHLLLIYNSLHGSECEKINNDFLRNEGNGDEENNNRVSGDKKNKNWILGVLNYVCDPFEVNEVKSVRVDVGSLKLKSKEEISQLHFRTFSLGQLLRFQSQLRDSYNSSRQNRGTLLELLNSDNKRGSKLNNSDTNNKIKKKKEKLKKEIKMNEELIGKQRLLLETINQETQNRYLTLLTVIYIYFNSFNSFNSSNMDIDNNCNNYNTVHIDSRIFKSFVLPILKSFSNGNLDKVDGEESGKKDCGDVNYFNNIILLKCLCTFNVKNYNEENVLKELRIYSSLLAELEKNLQGCENPIYVYKFETILKIIIDLLYLLCCNFGANSPSGKSSLVRDGAEKVLENILRILSGETAVCPYLYSVLIKLLIKVVYILSFISSDCCDNGLDGLEGVSDNYPHQTTNNPHSYHENNRFKVIKKIKWNKRKLFEKYLIAILEVAIFGGSCSVRLGDWDVSLLREIIFHCFSCPTLDFFGIFQDVISCSFSYFLNSGVPVSNILSNIKDLLSNIFILSSSSANGSGNNTNVNYNGNINNNYKDYKDNNNMEVQSKILSIVANVLSIVIRSNKFVEVGEVLSLIEFVLKNGKVEENSPEREKLAVLLKYYFVKYKRNYKSHTIRSLLYLLTSTSGTVSVNYPHFSINYPYNSTNTNYSENPHFPTNLNNNINKMEKEEQEKAKRILNEEFEEGIFPFCKFFRIEKIKKKRIIRRKRSVSETTSSIESLLDTTESETISSNFSD